MDNDDEYDSDSNSELDKDNNDSNDSQDKFSETDSDNRDSENFGVPVIDYNFIDDDAVSDWLRDNFEPSHGTSLQRSTIYTFYLDYCAQREKNPVNQASFGKLIRCVFMGIKTRRLGTRGNSKYHYYGIRLSSSSFYHKRIKNEDFKEILEKSCKEKIKLKHKDNGLSADFDDFDFEFYNAIMNVSDADGVSRQDLLKFTRCYKENNEKMFEEIVDENIEQALSGLKEFPMYWDYWHEVPMSKVCLSSKVQYYIERCDIYLYWRFIEFAVADVLADNLDERFDFTQRFIDESRHIISTTDRYTIISHIKCECLDVVCLHIDQMRNINKLKQYVDKIFCVDDRLSSVYTSLQSVDVELVFFDLNWICRCDKDIVIRIYSEMLRMLSQYNEVECWAIWINKTVNRFLLPFNENKNSFRKAGKIFVSKINAFCNAITKELTLRNCKCIIDVMYIFSFTSEYMTYLVLHKISEQFQQYPIETLLQDCRTKCEIEDLLVVPVKSEVET
ncbi:hypothetical protein GJ496_001919 [Pomphorhynchus laevis]|nr:hypothetical protein GJ496_001919 [Pomphorhynchus laevis]